MTTTTPLDRATELLRQVGLFPGADMQRRAFAEKHMLGGDVELDGDDMSLLEREAELRSAKPRAVLFRWIQTGEVWSVLQDLRHYHKRRDESAPQEKDDGETNRPTPTMAERQQAALVSEENCDGRIWAGIVFDRRTPSSLAKELGMGVDAVIAAARRHVARYPSEVELLEQSLAPKKPVKLGRGAKAKAEPVVTIPVAFAERALPRGDREVEW